MNYIVICELGGRTGSTRYYGIFANPGIANIWLDSHCTIKADSASRCDHDVLRHIHRIQALNDPMSGISRTADPDIIHALTGE